MSNLKVNARTKFLEMRKKHNMLLENVNVKVETSNIQTLTNEELDNLKCGDIVVKKTGNQKHAYIVSYKENNQGICLTYCDGSGYIETISYDKVGENWVYNSTDIFKGQEKLVSGTNIKTINSQSLLGSGDIAISGGTKLYKHNILDPFDNFPVFVIISTSSSPIVTQYKVINGHYVLINIPNNIVNLYCVSTMVYWGYIEGTIEFNTDIIGAVHDNNFTDTVTEL